MRAGVWACTNETEQIKKYRTGRKNLMSRYNYNDGEAIRTCSGFSAGNKNRLIFCQFLHF
jgi:hypothetical protein